MISSFSQEQFQQFYEFSGGGGGDNRKVPLFIQLQTFAFEKEPASSKRKANCFILQVLWVGKEFATANSLFIVFIKVLQVL